MQVGPLSHCSLVFIQSGIGAREVMDDSHPLVAITGNINLRVPRFKNQSVKTDGIQGFQFGNQKKKRETSAWQQRSIACSKSEIDFESC